MPGQNILRILTRRGRELMLMASNVEGGDGPFFNIKAIPVTAITIPPGELTFTDAVAAGSGVGTPDTPANWSLPQMSASGKLYYASDALVFTAGVLPTPQSVLGLVLTATNLTTDVIAYLEFDAPISIDEQGESIHVAIEVGFDGQTFYVIPRVLPLGE